MRKLIMMALVVLGTVNVFAQNYKVEKIYDETLIKIEFEEDGEYKWMKIYSNVAVYENDTTGYNINFKDYQSTWIEGGFFQSSFEKPLYFRMDFEDLKAIQEDGLDYVRFGKKLYMISNDQNDEIIMLANRVF